MLNKNKSKITLTFSPTILLKHLLILILILILLLFVWNLPTTTTTTTELNWNWNWKVVVAFSVTTSAARTRTRKKLSPRQRTRRRTQQSIIVAPSTDTISSLQQRPLSATTTPTPMAMTMTTNMTNNITNNDNVNVNNISLLQKRLYEEHGIPIGETILVRDNDDNEIGRKGEEDEEKKNREEGKITTVVATSTVGDNDNNNNNDHQIIEIKTLIWEVMVDVNVNVNVNFNDYGNVSNQNTENNTFYIVTALPMKEKVDISKLKKLVVKTTTNENAISLSIRSLQLAPLQIAESLTGYQSGCMPPICHTTPNSRCNPRTINNNNDTPTTTPSTNTTTNTMRLYIDESIIDIATNNNNNNSKLFASIGSGMVGRSLRLPLHHFIRVAMSTRTRSSGNNENDNINDNDNNSDNNKSIIGSFIASSSSDDDDDIEDHHEDVVINTTTSHSTDTHSSRSKESMMMSSIEVKKQQQRENKNENSSNYIGTKRKDRLKEYRSFRPNDLVSKSKLLRTTARKKGRVEEMKALLDEAIRCGDFIKLFQIHDSDINKNDDGTITTTRTNIVDKNALHICAWRGDYETVVRIIELSNQLYKNEQFDNFDIVNVISKGKYNYGKTPLFYALTQCREDVVQYLVCEAHANLLIVNNKGQTPCSIAASHLSEEMCQVLYQQEAEQLLLVSKKKNQNTNQNHTNHPTTSTPFINYRKSIHSDQKLYGDLDPRFPIDDDNRYNCTKKKKKKNDDDDDDDGGDNQKKKKKDNKNGNNRSYFPDANNNDTDVVADDDLAEQLQEYHTSIEGALPETIIDGIPTQFTPRSLRSTVRWWERGNRAYGDDGGEGSTRRSGTAGTDSSGQVTVTQSRRHRRKNNDNNNGHINPQQTTTTTITSTNGNPLNNNEDNRITMKPKILTKSDIESLDLISIDDILLPSTSTAGDDGDSTTENVSSVSISNNTSNNTILVDSSESLRLFEEEVDNCISDLQQQQQLLQQEPNDDVDNDDNGTIHVHFNDEILVKAAWGIDCEWQPGPDCGRDSPVATLQLGTSRKAFLIDVQTLLQGNHGRDRDREDGDSSTSLSSPSSTSTSTSLMEINLDRILSKLFRNPNLSLVGYGVVQDLGKLSASFPHLTCFSEFVSVIDLQSISSVIYNTKQDRGMMSSLQRMTATLLNKRLNKSQQVSDWSRRPLSQEQIVYAMLDAAIIPLLLKTIIEQNASVKRFNNEFFKVHQNLRSTIRYTLVNTCDEGFVYEITNGSIKSMLQKSFARQNWPTTHNVPPKLPTLVPYHHLPSTDDDNGDDDASPSTAKISKKERAHLKKIGVGSKGKKRPKPIPLKNLCGNLDNLPTPGITLGYTKESCAYRVVGHELFTTIPKGTYIGFNRRAGVIETSNAWILFCNFGGGPGKVFSGFSNNGKYLSFRVKATKSDRSSEASLYNSITVMSSSEEQSLSEEECRDDKMKKILLFARESTRTKYIYCGSCKCKDVIDVDVDIDTKCLVLELTDFDELTIDHEDKISTNFKDLVDCSLKRDDISQ